METKVEILKYLLSEYKNSVEEFIHCLKHDKGRHSYSFGKLDEALI